MIFNRVQGRPVEFLSEFSQGIASYWVVVRLVGRDAQFFSLLTILGYFTRHLKSNQHNFDTGPDKRGWGLRIWGRESPPPATGSPLGL